MSRDFWQGETTRDCVGIYGVLQDIRKANQENKGTYNGLLLGIGDTVDEIVNLIVTRCANVDSDNDNKNKSDDNLVAKKA